MSSIAAAAPAAGTRERGAWPVLAVFASWLLISRMFHWIPGVSGLGRAGLLTLATVRMLLLLAATWAYVRWGEGRTLREGVHLRWRRVGRNLLWAVIFAAVAMGLERAYQALVVGPWLGRAAEASAGGVGEVAPFGLRLFDYLYVVLEGIVEVLIFVGFLFDRLWRRWGTPAALVAANLGFALWHYGYWRKGLLEGSLMIGLTFLVGVVACLNYLKTRNTLSPTVAHLLVDSPTAIRELLGLVS